MPSLLFGIEVTRKCNLRCPHCYTRSGTSRAHAGPDPKALRELVSALAAAGVRDIGFSGGEPLLRHDLEDLMKHGHQVGVGSFGIVTNGLLATPERVRSLAHAGLRAAQVSIDGVDVADHCEVRNCKPGDYYRALRAVRLFRDAGITVDVACILSARNAVRAPEMALLCEALGARGLRYCSFVPTGRAVSRDVQQRFAMTEPQIDAFVLFMHKLAFHPKPPLRIMIDHGIGPWKPTGRLECNAGQRVAYCSAEGTLYPCPGLIFDEFAVGNVFRTPVGELLKSERLAPTRRIRHEDIHGSCRTCNNNQCTGGCRGSAYAVTGDLCGAPAYCFFRPSMRRRPRAPGVSE